MQDYFWCQRQNRSVKRFSSNEIQQLNQQLVNTTSQKVYPLVYLITETVTAQEQQMVVGTSNDEIARLLGSRNLLADETEVFDSFLLCWV